MCTHANQGTGYARVANKMTNALVEQGHDVVYYAFQNYPGQAVTDRFIDPRIRFIDALVEDPDSPKGFGDKGIVPNFTRECPDVLFLYNDLPVACSILQMIPQGPYKVYLYIDLVYPWEDIERLRYLQSRVDTWYVFLECWRTHLVDELQWPSDRVHVLRHGVDPIPVIENAKEQLGFKSTDFIFLNLNRNSYRKQWDVTIVAFLQCLKSLEYPSDLKLFCGCMLKTPDGYDIVKIIKTECLRLGIPHETIMTNHIFINPHPMISTDRYVHLMYNACDVGLNTCCGEGFGLTNAEHSTLGRLQIVSAVPAFKEILSNHALVQPACWSHVSGFESHGGRIAHINYEDVACAMKRAYLVRPKMIPETFLWDFSIWKQD